MKLTDQQVADFDRDGYLFFPGHFSPEETKALTDAVPDLYSRREAFNVREKGSDAVRTNATRNAGCAARNSETRLGPSAASSEHTA